MIFALVIITSIYLCAITVQDLRERQIYTFPCSVLTILWVIVNMSIKMEPWYMTTLYMVICVIIAKALDYKHIWGAGDSDLFVLFTILYETFRVACFSIESLCLEILLFALAMILSLGIAWVEAKIRKEKLGKNSSIAVAPGLAIVTMILMWKGVIGC